jgi:hypothetical protein
MAKQSLSRFFGNGIDLSGFRRVSKLVLDHNMLSPIFEVYGKKEAELRILRLNS